MAKIYVVEDDENIRELLLYALKAEDMEPYGFESGAEFFKKLEKEPPALVMLDLLLPGEDGLSILRRLRQHPAAKTIPVIILTAKGSEFDRIKGLDLGADDYIVKPFSMLEMISRINAVLRRSGRETAVESILSYESITLDSAKHAVSVEHEDVELTFKEFELLRYMMLNQGIALTREQMMNKVWGFDYEGESRTVDMHIKTLRQKLKSAGGLIKTVRSIGYKLGK